MFKSFMKLAALVLVLACSNAAYAQTTCAEVGDAGGLPATAFDCSGTGSILQITGTIAAGTDADMFRIFIANPMAFSATTVGTPGTLADTQLFLFSPTGFGIIGNDDDVGFRSTLPLGHPLITAIAPNTSYFLVITSFDLDPVDGAGMEIFTDIFPGIQTPIPGRGPIAGYGGIGSTGTYTIALTGAFRTDPMGAIPEPATMVLLGTGLAGVAGAVRRRRKANKSE